MKNKSLSLILVEDNPFYSALVESSVNMADDFFIFEHHIYSDEAEKKFLERSKTNDLPSIILVDINLVGSSFNGLEFIRKVNFEMGNGVVIGVISTSQDEIEKAQAKKCGAMFWINKSGDLFETIPKLLSELKEFESRNILWKEY